MSDDLGNSFGKENFDSINDLPSEVFPVEETPVEETPAEDMINLEEMEFSEDAAEEAQKEALLAQQAADEAEAEADELRRQYMESRRNRQKKVSRKRTVAEEILDWLKTICIGIIAGILLVIFVIQRDDVYGRSMQPTLNSGDVVFTQKISTYFNNYDRGDIVVLDGKGMYGYDKSEYLIKRVIGLPGETVKIDEGQVYIKPKDSDEFFILNETYLVPGTATTVRSYGVEHGYDEITLADNEYYCMGDNRPESNDSRTLGPFTTDRIKGVAVIRMFPFNSIKLL